MNNEIAVLCISGKVVVPATQTPEGAVVLLKTEYTSESGPVVKTLFQATKTGERADQFCKDAKVGDSVIVTGSIAGVTRTEANLLIQVCASTGRKKEQHELHQAEPEAL